MIVRYFPGLSPQPNQAPFNVCRGAAGFDGAMQAALENEPVLAADESPVNVLGQDADAGTGQPETGAPHVLVMGMGSAAMAHTRTPECCDMIEDSRALVAAALPPEPVIAQIGRHLVFRQTSAASRRAHD